MQVVELTYCVIRTSYCLRSLFPSDTDTNMRFHNHRHVICTVTNRYCNPTTIIFSECNNIGLLFWTHSAADNATGENTDLKESCCCEFVLHSVHQGGTINHNTESRFPLLQLSNRIKTFNFHCHIYVQFLDQNK